MDNKPISTRMHGVLDYLTVGTFLALPRAMGWSRPLTRAVDAVALGKLAYTLFTRHELGVVKKIPMKTHLALDVAGGAALCAIPWLLGDGEQDEGAAAALVSLGVFDIVAAPLTQQYMTRGAAPASKTQRSTFAKTGGRQLYAGGPAVPNRVLTGNPSTPPAAATVEASKTSTGS